MQINSFLSYLKSERRYSDHTVKAYENDLKQFYAFYPEFSRNFGEMDLKPKLVRQWIVFLMESGRSPRTVRRKVSALNSYFKFHLRRGEIVSNPASRVTLPKTGKRLPVFIPEKRLDQLIDEVDFGVDFQGVRDRLMIEMLYFTGMRRSELVNLKNSDVDTTVMTVKVTGKGQKQRLIPVTRVFSSTIMEYTRIKEQEFGPAALSDPFFLTSTNSRIYSKLVYRVVRKYLRIVTSVDKRGPHVLRHSFATHMLNHGAGLNEIKELLGHSNLSATQVYTHNTFDKLKRIYKQAHPRA